MPFPRSAWPPWGNTSPSESSDEALSWPYRPSWQDNGYKTPSHYHTAIKQRSLANQTSTKPNDVASIKQPNFQDIVDWCVVVPHAFICCPIDCIAGNVHLPMELQQPWFSHVLQRACGPHPFTSCRIANPNSSSKKQPRFGSTPNRKTISKMQSSY